MPNLVVVYVACLKSPADKPLYKVVKPSFLITPVITLNVLGFAAPLDFATCILVFTKSRGCKGERLENPPRKCQKAHSFHKPVALYLYKECGSHTREATKEEFDSIGDCFWLCCHPASLVEVNQAIKAWSF